MAFHLDLLSCCNTVTEAANEMLPTFPFVEIKSCFLKQSTALQSFPLTSTTVENQGTWGKERDTICDARDHKLELSSIAFVGKLNVRQSTVGGAMRLKKVAGTCGDCNYCTATSSQWALSDSHCPLLCTSHPGKTNIHERNLSLLVGGGQIQSTFVWPM